jgi:hypothetical protein
MLVEDTRLHFSTLITLRQINLPILRNCFPISYLHTLHSHLFEIKKHLVNTNSYRATNKISHFDRYCFVNHDMSLQCPIFEKEHEIFLQLNVPEKVSKLVASESVEIFFV